LGRSLRAAISITSAATEPASTPSTSKQFRVARIFGEAKLRTRYGTNAGRATRVIPTPTTLSVTRAAMWPIAESVETSADARHNGGRFDGTITLADGTDYATLMLAAGQAVVMT